MDREQKMKILKEIYVWLRENAPSNQDFCTPEELLNLSEFDQLWRECYAIIGVIKTPFSNVERHRQWSNENLLIAEKIYYKLKKIKENDTSTAE
jgi:hypothetical protein